jgi:hypothetical protein
MIVVPSLSDELPRIVFDAAPRGFQPLLPKRTGYARMWKIIARDV